MTHCTVKRWLGLCFATLIAGCSTSRHCCPTYYTSHYPATHQAVLALPCGTDAVGHGYKPTSWSIWPGAWNNLTYPHQLASEAWTAEEEFSLRQGEPTPVAPLEDEDDDATSEEMDDSDQEDSDQGESDREESNGDDDKSNDGANDAENDVKVKSIRPRTGDRTPPRTDPSDKNQELPSPALKPTETKIIPEKLAPPTGPTPNNSRAVPATPNSVTQADHRGVSDYERLLQVPVRAPAASVPLPASLPKTRAGRISTVPHPGSETGTTDRSAAQIESSPKATIPPTVDLDTPVIPIDQTTSSRLPEEDPEPVTNRIAGRYLLERLPPIQIESLEAERAAWQASATRNSLVQPRTDESENRTASYVIEPSVAESERKTNDDKADRGSIPVENQHRSRESVDLPTPVLGTNLQGDVDLFLARTKLPRKVQIVTGIKADGANPLPIKTR